MSASTSRPKKITFEQDIYRPLLESGFDQEKAHSLSLRCCSGFCYFAAIKELYQPVGPILDFIKLLYSPNMPGAHHLGLSHTEMTEFTYNHTNQMVSTICLDPLRTHYPPQEFKLKGSYAGNAALNFFESNWQSLNQNPSVANALKLILGSGGVAIVGAIQQLTNGYIGLAASEGENPTHAFMVTSYNKKLDLFTIFDPDLRSFEDLDHRRPAELIPLQEPGYYTVPADFLEAHSHKTYFKDTPQQKEGGIVVGLFKEEPGIKEDSLSLITPTQPR
jgi:hypothetical protein